MDGVGDEVSGWTGLGGVEGWEGNVEVDDCGVRGPSSRISTKVSNR